MINSINDVASDKELAMSSEVSMHRVGRPHEITVVTAGNCGVGKTALINRFIEDSFNQNYIPTTFSRYVKENFVGSRRVKYTIWDTSGMKEMNSSRSLSFREANVFLLCYSIGDPSSLFSAINHWVPDLRQQAPSTPIVLVGCQSDIRTDRSVVQTLAKDGKSPVSSQQALSMSQIIDAVMYVETSAKTSSRGAASVMEVAALASMGQFSPPLISSPKTRLVSPITTSNLSPLVTKKHRNRSLSTSRQFPKDMTLSSRLTEENVDHKYRETWDQLSTEKNSQIDFPISSQQQELPSTPVLNHHYKSGSLSSISLRSKSSTLSSTKSDSSMKSVHSAKVSQTISITTVKTPKSVRKEVEKENVKGEKMVTIKCQRLTADKTYEEVEIEVPESVYQTMQTKSDADSVAAKQQSEKRGFGTKIKCLFSKTSQ